MKNKSIDLISNIMSKRHEKVFLKTFLKTFFFKYRKTENLPESEFDIFLDIIFLK